jgi:integrase
MTFPVDQNIEKNARQISKALNDAGSMSPPLSDGALISADASPFSPSLAKKLTDGARSDTEPVISANTRRAYAADWKHFCGWARRRNFEILPPDPQIVGLYVTACASGADFGDRKPGAVLTIERRLSSLTWNFAQRGQPFDRKDGHIALVMAGIRKNRATPRIKKASILPGDMLAMLVTLDHGTLRGLRDRAMLLVGFAGGLRRSEIVGLDVGQDQTKDGPGWIEVRDKSLLVTLRGKAGSREVEIVRGSSDQSCPVLALKTWLKFARIASGPVFRRVTGKGKAVGDDRLNDQEVARLVKRAALAAGIRGDLSEQERGERFSASALRRRPVA